MWSSPVSSFCVRLRDSLSTHPRSSHFKQPNMTPSHDILHCRCPFPPEARHAARARSGIRAHEGGPSGKLNLQGCMSPPGKTKFADSTVGGCALALANSRASDIQSSSSRFVGRARKPAPSPAIARFCILESRASRRANPWIVTTHVFIARVCIGRQHPPVRTSPTSL